MASFSVVNNIASATAQANLHTTQAGLQKALNRLSSGYRINSSGDDAAGLVVANGYRTDVAIIEQGIRNANDGLSDLQIKDGAMSNIATLLDRLATLATQAASGTTSLESRTTLNDEFKDVVDEIGREADVARLTAAGTATETSFDVYVSQDHGSITGRIASVSTGSTSLAIDALNLTSAPTSAVTAVKDAIAALGKAQSKVGALQNRLQYAISLAQAQAVNIKAGESRIRDANVAEESANMTRYNILTQSGVAALAQANQSTSAVLSLLRG